jgi:glycosylphosphatidylinositol deacylase
MGHSMGRIEAISLLHSGLSTPFLLPDLTPESTHFDRLQITLHQDHTRILSICGVVTDMLISSESCILPQASNNTFRKDGLYLCLTGVDHREIVWCHQVCLQEQLF